ncbi:MAG: hypothetical protein ACHRXM_01385 [Isosphaerales bacterium]
MSNCLNLTMLVCLFGPAPWTVSYAAVAASDAGLLARIRAEATRLENTPASEVFELLGGDQAKDSLGLTEQQISYARRLDKLVRAVLKSALVRGQGESRPPSQTELAERLGEAGKRVRQALIAHAEAMVLEAVLTPKQASRFRQKLRRRPSHLLTGRYGLYRISGCIPVDSMDRFTLEMEQERRALDHGPLSHLFAILADHTKTPVKLSSEQVGLTHQLDRLNRDILSAWQSRNLIADRYPNSDWDAADWFAVWDKLRNSFIAHSEALVLDGVLTPLQAESFLGIYWRSMGPLALSDPKLAQVLKLSQTQRGLILEGLIRWEAIRDEALLFGIRGRTEAGELDARGRDRGRLAVEAERYLLAEADWEVWSVLTPAQLKMLEQVSGIAVRRPAPAEGGRPRAPTTRRRAARST